MKKILISILALGALSGCAYDYYHGDVRYTQSGDDCVYRMREHGRHFDGDVKSMNRREKVVYRDAKCARLYNQDVAPAVRPEPVAKPCAKKACGCNNTCDAPFIQRRHYVIY